MSITQEPHAGQLGKVMEFVLLEVISKHIKEKKVTVRHQHGYLKTKSCLMNVIAFCDYLTGLVGEGGEERMLLISSSVRLLTPSLITSSQTN